MKLPVACIRLTRLDKLTVPTRIGDLLPTDAPDFRPDLECLGPRSSELGSGRGHLEGKALRVRGPTPTAISRPNTAPFDRLIRGRAWGRRRDVDYRQHSGAPFEHQGLAFTLLDTPGHQDFTEDTYRTLTAVDSVVMPPQGTRPVPRGRPVGHP